jgi:hypothetical protein
VAACVLEGRLDDRHVGHHLGEELPEGPDYGLDDHRRGASELGDADRDVGWRPSQIRLKVDALLGVSVFSTEMKSTTISPVVRMSRGPVSGAIGIQSN